MTLERAGGARWSGLGLTVALHMLLAALFMLRQSAPEPAANASWIQLVDVPAIDESGMMTDPQEPRPVKSPHRTLQAGSIPALPVTEPAPVTVPEQPFPEAAPAAAPSLFELARAAAGDAARAVRKEFPEHPNLLRARERTPQQKLASGIANSLAAPKLYEAPRITAIQDQGVGWGRRIDKVVTGMGTYCITYESNHGGDGRDVFKDALEPKIRTCPREE